MNQTKQAQSSLNSTPLSIGEWVFYPNLYQLTRGEQVVKLEPRVAHLLLILASSNGESQTREYLIEQAWPNVIVGDEVLTSAINKLRKAFDDNSLNPMYIQTIPKLGYCLVAEVSESESQVQQSEVSEKGQIGRTPHSRRNTAKVLLAGFSAVLVISVILFYTFNWPGTQQHTSDKSDGSSPSYDPSSRPMIVVLPFSNLSSDSEQEYFVDGMTDDLISDLSKVPELNVISRTSSFAFKGEYQDVRKIAKALNAQYAIEGSVRRLGDMVRINVQLTDAQIGNNIWAQSYDRPLDDIFTLQDSITNEVIGALNITTEPSNRVSVATSRPKNMALYDKFLKANGLFQRFSRDDTFKARELYAEVTKLDAQYAQAYAMLAWTYVFEYTNGWSKNPDATLNKALELANQCLSLNKRMPIAHFVKGLVYRERREFDKAEFEASRAIEIEPSYANGYVLVATLRYYAGKPEEGLDMLNIASRLNPIHPSNYPFHKGQALFILTKYEEAIESFKSGLEQNPTSERLRVWLAATYAQVGMIDEANWEAVQILNEDPEFSLTDLETIFPFRNNDDRERFVSALRRAGFKKVSIN